MEWLNPGYVWDFIHVIPGPRNKEKGLNRCQLSPTKATNKKG
jgi:hypothetical protein